MQEVLAHFIAAADEVGRLQRSEDPECRFFQSFAEEGHYGGRVKPTSTRQGIYAIAPSGRFLASINTRNAEHVAKMLREALDKWEMLAEAERYLADQGAAIASVARSEDRYPEDGLVLRVHARDLPGGATPHKWHETARNMDHAWFTRDEAAAFMPDNIEVGAELDVPESLVQRLVALNLVDHVRGQVLPFDDKHIEKAHLTARITELDDARITLELTGDSRAVARGTWPVRGFDDMHAPTEQERGIETTMLGRALYDRDTRRFTSFDLIARGTRWGGTQYNGRGDDLEPSPIGFLLTLAPPDDRVAPAFIWRYRWGKRDWRSEVSDQRSEISELTFDL